MIPCGPEYPDLDRKRWRADILYRNGDPIRREQKEQEPLSTNAVNPYQPPTTAIASAIDVDDDGIRFFTTEANLRFAESHFVLRLHPVRLIIVSLLLIAASSVVMVSSQFFGTIVFGISSIAVMVISALVYLASVFRTKLKLRQRWSNHGLQDGTISSVAIEDDDFVLKSPSGVFRWPIESTKTYRTRKGLMISPEPLLCVFVPKKNQSAPPSYDDLQSRLGK